MKERKNTDGKKKLGDHHSDETKTLVHGAIQVHAAPDLIEKHEAERKEDAAQKKDETKITKWTFWAVVVYSGLTFILVLITAYNTQISKHTYNETVRAYIGLNSLGAYYQSVSPDGTTKATPSATNDSRELNIQAEIKNFGPVPGTNCTVMWNVFIDGLQINGRDKIPDRPQKLFPGELVFLRRPILEPNYSSIVVKRDKILTVEVTIEYDAPKHEKECESLRFEPITSTFMRLGPCGR